MSKISMFVLVIGLVMGISGIAFFLYGMNSKAEIPVASISESMNSDENISSEGVKVRGDWEVTVSDPDGSNPSVYNFQNAIYPTAFNVISRGLLPEDHEKTASVSGYFIELKDYYSNTSWLICIMGYKAAFFLEGEGSVLFVEPKLGESEGPYLTHGASGWDEYWGGITLTGSCRVSEPPEADSDTPIEVDAIRVFANFTAPPDSEHTLVEGLFAEEPFNKIKGQGYTDAEIAAMEDPIIISSPGQMISVTVDFTLE